MEHISRREFFSRKVLGQLWQKTGEGLSMGLKALEAAQLQMAKDDAGQSAEETVMIDSDERVVMPEYFSSPLYSYALLSEMPWDMLIDEAKKLGIAYENRSKIDVVREIFMGTGGEGETLR